VPETVSAVELAYGKVLAVVAVDVIAPAAAIAPRLEMEKYEALLELAISRRGLD